METISSLANDYVSQNGRIEHNYTIPHKGNFSYIAYFWTVAFAKYIIGRHLNMIHEYKLENSRYLLIFENI